MKNIVVLFILVTLTGCGVMKDIHIEEQEEYFRLAIKPIRKIIPSNPQIVFNVSGKFEPFKTEEIEITNIKVVPENIRGNNCNPAYPQIYYYYCDVGITYASYYEDRFDNHEKNDRGHNFTATFSLQNYYTTKAYRYSETTNQKKVARTSIVTLPFWEKYREDIIRVSSAAKKYQKLNKQVYTNLGPEYSKLDLLRIHLEPDNNFSLEKLISIIEESSDEQTLITRYKRKMNEKISSEKHKEEQKNLRLRKQEELRLKTEEKIRLEKLAQEKFNNHQINVLSSQNKVNKKVWENRISVLNASNRGDKICSYIDNKVGFIEDIVEDKVKVLWKAKIISEDGFAFGNLPFSVMDRKIRGAMNYEFTSINDVTWVSKDSVSTCDFNI